MKNPVPILFLLLLGLFVVHAWTYSHYCCAAAAGSNSEAALSGTTAAETLPVAVPASAGLLIADQANDFMTSTEEFIRYPLSSFNFEKPLSEGLTGSLQQTADYLAANPDRSLMLTGLYAEEETNNSLLPNLGLARAADLRKMLVKLGAPATSIGTDASLRDESNVHHLTDSAWLNPFVMTFAEKVAGAEDKWAAFTARLSQQPLTLYFQYAKNTLELTAAQRSDIATLIDYLAENPEASATVTGHTDSEGSRLTNTRLAQKRAESVLGYLLDNGIEQGQLNAASMGPDAPIASNSTEEGRAKNRRVEITLP